MNPYFSLGAMFALGLRGIEKKLPLPFPPVGHPEVTPSTLPKLATSLEAATATFSARKSVARECFGDEVSSESIRVFAFFQTSSLTSRLDLNFALVRDSLRRYQGGGGREVQADGDELGGGEVSRAGLSDAGREIEEELWFRLSLRLGIGYKVLGCIVFDDVSTFCWTGREIESMREQRGERKGPTGRSATRR